MITREDILAELARRGIDPNQFTQNRPAIEPKPIQHHNINLIGAWSMPPYSNVEQIPNKQWFVRNAPAVGGTVGGTLGGLLSGGPWGAAGGAALGGAWGKSVQLNERMDKGEPLPLPYILGEQAKSAAWEGGTELIVPGVSKVGKKVLKPFAKKVIPYAPGLDSKLADIGDRLMKSKFAKDLTEEQANYLTKGGRVHFTAAMQTIDPALDHAEEMVRGSLLGSDLEILRNYLIPKTLKLSRAELSESLWKELGRKMTDVEVGRLFKQAVVDKQKFAQKIISALYKNLDDVAKGVQVDLRPVKQFANEELLKSLPRMKKGPAREIQILAKQITNLPDTASFSDTIFHHSDLLYVLRKLEAQGGPLAPKNPQALRFVKKSQSIMDDLMKNTAKAHSDELAHLHEIARTTKRKLHEDIISNEFITGAIKKSPEDVAKYIFDDYEATLAVHKIATPKTWNALVASKMEQLLETAASATTGEVTEMVGEQVVKGRRFLDLFEGLGPEIQKEMFPNPSHIQAIIDFGHMHRLAQDPVGATGGKMLIKLVQASAIVATALGRFEPASAAIILGPKELSKLMASETGIRWLTVGLQTPADSAAAGIIKTNLLRLVRELTLGEKEAALPKKTLDWNPFKGMKPGRILPPLFSEDEQQNKQNLLLKTTR